MILNLTSFPVNEANFLSSINTYIFVKHGCYFHDELMIINCIWGIVCRRKFLRLVSSRYLCQRFLSSAISDTPYDFVKWIYAVVITTTPRRLYYNVFAEM